MHSSSSSSNQSKHRNGRRSPRSESEGSDSSALRSLQKRSAHLQALYDQRTEELEDATLEIRTIEQRMLAAETQNMAKQAEVARLEVELTEVKRSLENEREEHKAAMAEHRATSPFSNRPAYEGGETATGSLDGNCTCGMSEVVEQLRQRLTSVHTDREQWARRAAEAERRALGLEQTLDSMTGTRSNESLEKELRSLRAIIHEQGEKLQRAERHIKSLAQQTRTMSFEGASTTESASPQTKSPITIPRLPLNVIKARAGSPGSPTFGVTSPLSRPSVTLSEESDNRRRSGVEKLDIWSRNGSGRSENSTRDYRDRDHSSTSNSIRSPSGRTSPPHHHTFSPHRSYSNQYQHNVDSEGVHAPSPAHLHPKPTSQSETRALTPDGSLSHDVSTPVFHEDRDSPHQSSFITPRISPPHGYGSRAPAPTPFPTDDEDLHTHHIRRTITPLRGATRASPGASDVYAEEGGAPIVPHVIAAPSPLPMPQPVGLYPGSPLTPQKSRLPHGGGIDAPDPLGSPVNLSRGIVHVIRRGSSGSAAARPETPQTNESERIGVRNAQPTTLTDSLYRGMSNLTQPHTPRVLRSPLRSAGTSRFEQSSSRSTKAAPRTPRGSHNPYPGVGNIIKAARSMSSNTRSGNIRNSREHRSKSMPASDLPDPTSGVVAVARALSTSQSFSAIHTFSSSHAIAQHAANIGNSSHDRHNSALNSSAGSASARGSGYSHRTPPSKHRSGSSLNSPSPSHPPGHNHLSGIPSSSSSLAMRRTNSASASSLGHGPYHSTAMVPSHPNLISSSSRHTQSTKSRRHAD